MDRHIRALLLIALLVVVLYLFAQAIATSILCCAPLPLGGLSWPRLN